MCYHTNAKTTLSVRKEIRKSNLPVKTIAGNHIFDIFCEKNGIEPRPTKPYISKTNDMFERFNRRIQENVFDKFKFKSIEIIRENYTFLECPLFTFNRWLEQIENYPESFKEMKENPDIQNIQRRFS